MACFRAFGAVAALRTVAVFKSDAHLRKVEDLRAVWSFTAVFGAFRADLRQVSGAKIGVACISQD